MRPLCWDLCIQVRSYLERSPISITEQEFNHAIQKGRPAFCFFIDEDHPWPPKFVDSDPGRNKLKDLKNRIKNKVVVDFFTTAEDLKQKVTSAIARYQFNINLKSSQSDPKANDAKASSGSKVSDSAPVSEFATESSTAFFASRFREAFPGIREVTWFEAEQAVERLSVLLESPLAFSVKGGGNYQPIWWFGRGNNSIERIGQIDATTVLMDIHEIRLGRIAAGYSPNYKRLFVYVESVAMDPTGLYPRSLEDLERCKQTLGYVAEEYGLYQGEHKVTRAEYDDNGAVINGKLIKFRQDIALRVRYITSYNMIIAAHESPINNDQFDMELESWLNRLLHQHNEFNDFLQRVRRLKIPPSWHNR